MSRSNTNYHNLCHRWGDIGDDGYCDFHRPRGKWWSHSKCIPPGEFLTRRGLVRRKPRFPEHSVKSWHYGPPSCWWRIQHRRARAIQAAEMRRNPEDPAITPDRKLIDLWAWY